MTANAMSSAPNTPPREVDADFDDQDVLDAAQSTEEFLASFMHASNNNDGYRSPPYESIQINANMMGADEGFFLLSDQEPSTAAPVAAREAQNSTRQYAIQRMLDEFNSSSSEIRPPPRGVICKEDGIYSTAGDTQPPPASSASPLFDDCYVDGKHVNPAGIHGITPGRYPHNHFRQTGAINPSERPAEIPLTYLQAFHTDLTKPASFSMSSRLMKSDET